MTDAEKADKLARFRRIQEFVHAGYGGVMPNGNIVDRRQHPEAVPIPRNTLLGVPTPQPVAG